MIRRPGTGQEGAGTDRGGDSALIPVGALGTACAMGMLAAGSVDSSSVFHRTLAYVSGASSSRICEARWRFGHTYVPGDEGHLGVMGDAGTVGRLKVSGWYARS